jgi:hypothetical protein
MRTITGMIGRTNRHNYRLVTDVATIGIRGTEYSVRYTNSIEVFCAGGSIYVENDGGTLILNGGEGARVLNLKSPPTRTQEPPVLAPQAALSKEEKVDEKIEDPKERFALKHEESLAEQIAGLSPAAAAAGLTGTFTGNWGMGHQWGGAQAWVGESVTLDAAGGATDLANALEGPVGIGGARAYSDGNDGIIAWGRWMNGTTGGSHWYFSNVELTGSDAMHYVVGLPVTNMPASGTAYYDMIGHTAPTVTGSITSAAINGSRLLVSFASLQAYLSIDMTVDGQPYVAAASLTRSGEQLSGWGPIAEASGYYGSCYFYGCGSLYAQGFLSGPGASRAGVVYDADFYEYGSVYGAIAYAKAGEGALRGVTMPGNWTMTTTDYSYPSWVLQDNNVATFDAGGAATGFANSFEGPFDRGTATAVPDGNDGIIAWGRWISGTTGGSNPYYGGQPLAGSQVLHYVAGLPATNLPASGMATYTMLGATPPSFNGQVTDAAVHGSSITVDFGSTSASFGIDMTINSARAGHTVPLVRGGAYLSGADNVTVNGGFEGGTLAVTGFLAGEGASRAGAAYQFTLYGFGDSRVSGAIGYRRQ